MPVPSPVALAPVPQAVSSQQAANTGEHAQPQPWKINQLVSAQVVRLAAGETAVRINGQLYTPLTTLTLKPGENRQLRVASLDPVIKLTTIEGGGAREFSLRPFTAAAPSLHSSLWAATVSSGPYKLAALLTVFQNPPRILHQNLTPQVQAKLNAIAALLPDTDDLRSVARLKQALANVTLSGREPGLGTARNDASELGRLMQSLQQQLSRQAHEQQNMARSTWPVDSYKGEQAMRSSVSLTLLNLLEDALGFVAIRGQRQAGITYLPLQRWSWEFPLSAGNRGRLFSLSAWKRQRQKGKTGIASTIWSLRCACELANYGFLAIVLRLKNQDARIHLQCESEYRCRELKALQAGLDRQLSEYGISLKRFSCSDIRGELAPRQENRSVPTRATGEFEDMSCLTESMKDRMRHAAVTGKLPVLENFSVANGTADPSPTQLPDRVYQALACLFDILLADED